VADRPVILVVDHDQTVLASMLDAPTRRFDGDYQGEASTVPLRGAAGAVGPQAERTEAVALVTAAGATGKRLQAPDSERLVVSSIFYAMFGQINIVRGQQVAAVGGGNSAGQTAIHPARFAREVTLLVRGERPESRMSD